MGWVVEKEWVSAAGLRCAAVRGGVFPHRCGYVAVEEGHPLYGVQYGKGAVVLGKTEYDWHEAENTSPAEKIRVHGGVTFSDGDGEYPVEGDGLWWFGFDCAHFFDKEEGGQSLEYVVAECESMAEQLREIGKGVA